MKCNDVKELLLELADGKPAGAEVERHLASCPECAGELAGLRSTMALLDEWTAPEPSPYFNTRLQARLREEREQEALHAGSWLAWLRRPAAAVAFMVLLALGIGLYQGGVDRPADNSAEQFKLARANGEVSAVADLRELDRDHDLYAEFDLLDDWEPHSGVNR